MDYFVVTQNWDGKVEDYGLDKDKIWELYGSISYYQNGEEIVECGEFPLKQSDQQERLEVVEAPGGQVRPNFILKND